MITFNEPIGGALAPNHYIEIAADPGGADGKAYAQPQRILVCLQSKVKGFVSEKTSLDAADLVIKTAREAAEAEAKKTAEEKAAEEAEKAKRTAKVKEADALREKERLEALKEALTTKEVIKTVRGCNKSSDLYFLNYLEGELGKALEKLPEQQFTQIALDNPVTKNIEALTTELDSRWKSDSQLEGHLFVSSTTPESLNIASKHTSLIHREAPEQTDLTWSAAFAALNALYATSPSRPYTTLKVPGLSSKLVSSLTKRNNLLKAKVSTYKTNISGEVFIDRLITTSEDPEYLSLEVKQTLSAVRYDLRKYFETRFKRYMLVKENHPYPGPVLSPKSIKALLVARYRLYQSQNLLQDDGEVTKRIRVEVSKTNASKIDIFFPVVVMGQLLITETQIAFRT